MAKTTKKIKKSKKTTKSSFVRKNKKNIPYAIVAMALVVVIAIGTIFVLNSFKTSDMNTNPNTTVKTSADSLKKQAIEALHNNPTLAKSLFQQALKKYKVLGDKNNIVDVNSQLYLIAHTKSTR